MRVVRRKGTIEVERGRRGVERRADIYIYIIYLRVR